MTSAVYTEFFDAPPVDRREILRYAGVKAETPELAALLSECLAKSERAFEYKVCYAKFPIIREENALNLGFARTESAGLRKNLRDCDSVVLFAATVGVGIDRLIAKYSRIAPSEAFLFQAIGAERIESLCDAFNAEITAKYGGRTAPRFSPGYGDLPLALQTDIFRVLDCPRKIGLTLGESLLMTPSKSVTAIIGAGAEPRREISRIAL